MSADELNLYGPPAAARIFAHGEEYQPPAQLLTDLTPTQATTVPAGAPYSVAEVLAHVVFWQDTWLARVAGAPPPPPARGGAHGDWPPVAPDGWTPLVGRFLSGLGRVGDLAGGGPEALSRTLDDGRTVGQTLLHLVQYNNYHFGQIALLRQLSGLWPTAEGADDAWEESLHDA